jgi:hypothetical protein
MNIVPLNSQFRKVSDNDTWDDKIIIVYKNICREMVGFHNNGISGKRTRIHTMINKYIGQFRQFIIDMSDNVIFSSMYYIVRADKLPPLLGDMLKSVIYFLNDVAWFLRDFPRIKAFCMRGENWSVVFVGGYDGYPEIQDLIFSDQEVQVEHMAKVPMWRLPKQTSIWLDSGFDLVVCELSRLCPWKPKAQYSFDVPDRVTQVLDIPESLDDLLSGRRIRGPRRVIRQAEKQGLSYRFTQSTDDLKFFYHEMYLPYIKSRHQELANLCSIEDHERWLPHGGLIMVSRNGDLVGGSLITISNRICQGIEMGILQCDPELIRSGANSLIVWSNLLYSKEQGASKLILGGSHPYCSKGYFRYKARWGARVKRHELNSRPNWVFLSNQFDDSLREHINQKGLISESSGRFYRTFIPDHNNSVTDELKQDASKSGLEGLAVIRPGGVQFLNVQSES